MSDDIIRKRVLRTGDGTHRYSLEELKGKNTKELLEMCNELDTNHDDSKNNNNVPYEPVDNLWGWGEFTHEMRL